MMYLCSATRRHIFALCRIVKILCFFFVLLVLVHFHEYSDYSKLDNVNAIGESDELPRPSKTESIPDIVFSKNVRFRQQVLSFSKRQTFEKIDSFRNNSEQKTLEVPLLPRQLTLLIVVCSHPEHVRRRQTIRTTWAAEDARNSSTVHVIFLIGRSSGWTKIIKRESTFHRDILQISVRESYKNLSSKLIEGMKWISRNVPSARFYMKCDDDVFINIPAVLSLLQNGVIDRREILGAFVSGARVIRDSRDKWSVPISEYRLPTFPPYVTGGAYVMTTTALKSLLAAAATTTTATTITLEDVYITGILAARANISHVNSPGFSYWMSSKAKPCDVISRRRLVSVNMDEKEILALYDGIQKLLITNKAVQCIK